MLLKLTKAQVVHKAVVDMLSPEINGNCRQEKLKTTKHTVCRWKQQRHQNKSSLYDL